jgi:hypothetical protein
LSLCWRLMSLGPQLLEVRRLLVCCC